MGCVQGGGCGRDPPGQGALQVIFCTDMPSHKAPPLSGAGLVQVRDLLWMPRPHCTLQADHSVHRDQPPFTVGKVGGVSLRVCVCVCVTDCLQQ